MRFRHLDESYFINLRFATQTTYHPYRFSSLFFFFFLGNLFLDAPFIFAIGNGFLQEKSFPFSTLPLFYRIFFIYVIIDRLILLILSVITHNKTLCIQHQKFWMLPLGYTFISFMFNIACIFLIFSDAYMSWISYIVLITLVIVSFINSSYQFDKRLQQGFYKAKKRGLTYKYAVLWKLFLISLIIILPYFIYLIHLNFLPLFTLLSMILFYFPALCIIMLISHYLPFFFLLTYCKYHFSSFTITENASL